MNSSSLLVIQVTDLGVGQESGLILGGGSLLLRSGLGGGGAAGVASTRLGGLCTGVLAVTVRVLDLDSTGLNAGDVIGVSSFVSSPTLGPDTKGGLFTLTPVGWWPDCQLVYLPGA